VVADYEVIQAIDGRRIFSDEQVARIVDAAVRSETWKQRTIPDVDTRALSIQFHAIVARGTHGAIPAPQKRVGSVDVRLQPITPAPAERTSKRILPIGLRFVLALTAVAVGIPVAGIVMLTLISTVGFLLSR